MIPFSNISNEGNLNIRQVLTDHHEATKTKNTTLLRRLFTSSAIFVGTDDSEVWSVDELVYALEGSENGWDMTRLNKRVIQALGTKIDRAAAFYEVVVHSILGPMRGSGVVVLCPSGEWKIAQYILSFSVPNHTLDKTNILELLKSGTST